MIPLIIVSLVLLRSKNRAINKGFNYLPIILIIVRIILTTLRAIIAKTHFVTQYTNYYTKYIKFYFPDLLRHADLKDFVVVSFCV